jgi:dTDP-4-dehydrorhamnose reductase/beta-phosphoglucomutase-like phosphatase (HAD superfamily)
MTILITGSQGLLGKEIIKVFEDKKIDFIGTYNINYNSKNKDNKFVYIDFFEIQNIYEVIKLNNITCIINLIAIKEPDVCEKNFDLTYKTNVLIVENLINICNKLNIKLIQISTDYVFDGLNPPYNINSLQNPLQYYGISKLIAEKRIINMCHSYIIIRTPVLYSLNSKFIDSPITIIGKNIMNLTKKYKIDDYYIRRPVNCKDLSEYILKLLINNENGIHHYYNPNEKYTKYEIGKYICKLLNCNNIEKIEINLNDVIRPFDTQLISNIKNDYNSNLIYDIETIFNKYKIPNLNNNSKNFIFLLDLDGTIVSEEIHYLVYKHILKKYDIDFKKEEYIESTNNEIYKGKCTNYLLSKKYINETQADEISILKKKALLDYDYEIKLIPNFEVFLNKILQFTDRIVVVTNSDKNYVNYLKGKINVLNKINFFITRDDYTNPKPSNECYIKALNIINYDNQQDIIIGIENSILGLKSISQVTNCIFGCCYDYSIMNNFDGVYYFNDYIQLLDIFTTA